jgi:solute:Na+ symporter, SSS family
MTTWLIIFFCVFLGLLVLAAMKSYSKNRTADDYILAGSNLGAILGFLTFAGALFSAFTFLGMPDFFRVHGLGGWIFLAFSDSAMVFFILWFGYKLRKKVAETGFRGVSGLMTKAFGTPLAGYLFFITAFIFLVPYMAIQIRGISIFLNASVSNALPGWAWSAGILIIMFIYAGIGGLKAIVYSDAIQSLLLLLIIWIIGVSCLNMAGGMKQMFESVAASNAALLTLPGPKGLFSIQFLIASTIAIMAIPVTQPQLTTRLVVVKDLKSVHKMAYAVGIFAIVVILPTVFIGMYGAVKYANASTADFLSAALLYDQADVVAALAVVGLFAACLSTTNAKIFALGSELRSMLPGDGKRVMLYTRTALFTFSCIVLVFTIYMSDELALLARLSFTGTSTMVPVVLSAVIFQRPPRIILVTSALALVAVVLSTVSIIPAHIGGWNFDMLLYMIHGGLSVLIMGTHSVMSKRTAQEVLNPKV